MNSTVERSAPAQDRDALYRELEPIIYRLIRQYGDSAEMRQDLTGELYYRFCVILDDYDPTRGVPLRPYLIRHLTTSAYSYARRHWHRRGREVSMNQEFDWVEPLDGHEDPTNRWVETIDRKEIFSSLSSEIDRLPPRQKAVVVGRYLEAQSFEEMANRLGIREASVRSTLRHGLCNLRRKLNGGRKGKLAMER